MGSETCTIVVRASSLILNLKSRVRNAECRLVGYMGTHLEDFCISNVCHLRLHRGTHVINCRYIILSTLSTSTDTMVRANFELVRIFSLLACSQSTIPPTADVREARMQDPVA
jgi:hypothetical protein